MTLGCGMDHVVETENAYTAKHAARPTSAARCVFSIDAEPGKPFALYQVPHVPHVRQPSTPAELRARAGADARPRGAPRVRRAARRPAARTWTTSGSAATSRSPRPASTRALQQCLRWNLFQLLQATGRVENAGVPAKGLTGQAYEGHYFWDMEIYVLPFLIYTSPRARAQPAEVPPRHARQGARARARELNQKGALFPWRTISGEEASAYYAAGTAQYHINAAIAYAHRRSTSTSPATRSSCASTAPRCSSRPRGSGTTWASSPTAPGRQVLHPQRDRPRRVHHRRQQQHLHQPDGAREPAGTPPRRSTTCAAQRPPAGTRRARAPHRARARRGGRLAARGRQDVHPLRRAHRRSTRRTTTSSTARVWDLKNTPQGQVPAAAPLSPAGHLPPPGDQAGRHRAGDVPARQRVHAGAEEAQLRLLRPAHDRRLVARRRASRASSPPRSATTSAPRATSSTRC